MAGLGSLTPPRSWDGRPLSSSCATPRTSCVESNGQGSCHQHTLEKAILIPLSTLLCIIRGLENINERDEKSLTIPLIGDMQNLIKEVIF